MRFPFLVLVQLVLGREVFLTNLAPREIFPFRQYRHDRRGLHHAHGFCERVDGTVRVVAGHLHCS